MNEDSLRPSSPVSNKSMLTLSKLIQPLTTDAFFAEYWERRPHCAKGLNNPILPSLTLGEIEHFILSLYSINYHPDDIKMSQEGVSIDFTEFTRPSGGKILVDPEKVFLLFRRGATIILNRINRVAPQISLVCRDLQLYFGVLVQANAYFTPPNAQGFGVHFDGHDVFIVQMFGEKCWKVYESEFPYATEESASLQDRGKIPKTKVVVEHVLREGEVLYIPRGFPHEAVAKDSASFHATIGVHPHTWAEALRDIISNAIATTPSLRQSLMSRFNPRTEDLSKLSPILSSLVKAVFTDANLRKALMWRYDREWDGMGPVLNGYLTDILSAPKLGDSDQVSIRTTVALSWEERDSVIILRFHQKRLELPGYLKPVLERMLEATPFSAKELPGGLSLESRLLLVRRLLEEGLLQLHA